MAAPVLQAARSQEAAGLGDSVPIQIDTSANQISALNIVHNSFQDQKLRDMKRKLADITLELKQERRANKARRQDEVQNLNYIVGEAQELIDEARGEIETVIRALDGVLPSSVKVLQRASNTLNEAECTLSWLQPRRDVETILRTAADVDNRIPPTP